MALGADAARLESKMSVRAVVLVIVGIFVLSLVASVGLLALDRRAISPDTMSGQYFATVPFPRDILLNDKMIKLDVGADRTFQMTSELGRVDGTYTLRGAFMSLDVKSINGRPFAEWPKAWKKQSQQLIHKAYLRMVAGGPAIPGYTSASLPDEATFKKTYNSMFGSQTGNPFDEHMVLKVIRVGKSIETTNSSLGPLRFFP